MVSVEKMVEELLKKACHFGASDIHLLPKKDDVQIFFRVDGELKLIQRINKEKSKRIIMHLKFLGSMDIGEIRRPQTGILVVNINEILLSLRLATLPTIIDESMVIRIHPQQKIAPIESLSLFPSTTRKLLSLLHHSHGLMMFTGPTGCGKTTTLYSLLQSAKKDIARNIITLEDPIERKSDEYFQVQVNEKAGLTYATGLKAILRSDPDIVMVGEIRDEETAKIAVRAALTGHLVLTTIHSNNTKGALYRMLELGIPKEELFQAIVAIVSQRLVPVKCRFCEGDCEPNCFVNRNHRRLGVYELLYGNALNSVINEFRGIQEDVQFPTLNNQLIKGYALGFIDNKHLDRSIIYG
ncbi:competence type IV pilus ATPase ComGA [Bacillus sp. AFS088145]|uniref:competence type IV pilus ATPase ComGA n=1 Tax=Bacillus sp. AFS088145 TaxID=2033514 RepID=UPI000BF503F4|nr:competence type IV pilus ATPase ComGA [Bacillus sp. AFS088145]PFH84826.1 competence protein ComG [Bacillus sp. AFS088145]